MKEKHYFKLQTNVNLTLVKDRNNVMGLCDVQETVSFVANCFDLALTLNSLEKVENMMVNCANKSM